MSSARKVLFVTIDQVRGEALGAWGHACARTPALDRLAAEGVGFRRHFVQCSPCGPSRASLLTGLYQMNHRSVRNGTPLDPRHRTLGLEARRAGYDPVLFGYTDTSPDPRTTHPADPALRNYEGAMPGFTVGCHLTSEGWPWRARLARLGYDVPAEPLGIYRPVDGGAGFAAGGEHPPRPVYDAEHSDTAFLTDAVLEHLAPRRHEDWFVHVSYLRPHPPLIAPDPWDRHVDPADVPLPARPLPRAQEAARHPFLGWLHAKHGRPGVYTGHDVDMAGLPERELRQVIATYYGLMAEVDHHIGRIVSHLKDTGQLDETLIVVTSDHGEMLGDAWLFGKEGYHDRSFHVPLIVRDPRPAADATRGTSVTAFTEAVDVMPTLLDWMGAEPPHECDGASLLPFVHGDPPALWRGAAHWEFDFRDTSGRGGAEERLGLAPDACALAVLRGSRWKSVHFTALPPLLFDLDSDPHETRDLAADPDHRAAALEMAREMLSWRMLHADRRLANTVLTPDGPVESNGPRLR